MRLKTIPALIGVSLIAVWAIGVTAAGATSTSPASNEVAALKRVGMSWVTYAATGNAPKACRLQVEPNVEGVQCDQLPTFFETIYCPADTGDDSPSPWRTTAEQVGNTKVNGKKGSIVFRATRKRSRLRGKASFLKVGGKWRIASFQSGGQRLIPAGLIFTEGKELRKKLWPSHC